MDPNKIRVIRDAINKRLEGIEKEIGCKLRQGNATYTPSSVKIALEISEVAADGTVQTKEMESFKALATLYGLKPEDLGRTFTSNGRTFKLVGLKSRASRLPFLGEEVGTGRVFKFTEATMNQLKASVPAAV